MEEDEEKASVKKNDDKMCKEEMGKSSALFQAHRVCSRKLNETRMNTKWIMFERWDFRLFVHEINPRSFIFA